ncbi:hypothetical protein EUGRSUZ_J01296 [Eucalyptus grandis]|uniref:Uncharacterized protein n=2 Tax=Eucalyptus grandis TaxID=71139 RepID=A0ACC3JYB8_EUCGR|nr:hypothetical protein EUGRSUZ_J01296 [Eucalyptus grandis]
MDCYYEVFLSFRGSDTCQDIANYLYIRLMQAGIQAYRDNEELPVREKIGPELVQAIKQSKISIPILSKEYAASSWCLMELVQMVDCMENWGQKIMPIFYDVAPSEVHYQTARYGEAINSHINKGWYSGETLQNWKAALTKVGALKGWELKERGKGEFIEEVVQKVLIELKGNYLAVSNCLVEMDDQVDKIMEVIGGQITETKIVGIYGMGGVGKTTLAKIIYNKLSVDSSYCCFLSNIQDTKIVSLQKKLISDVQKGKCLPIHNYVEGITEIKKRLSSKKVMLVLDDVDQKIQLDALVGVDEPWFGRGSKVIITTRNKELLRDVDFQHELIEMDFSHSLQLFSIHAFGRDHPSIEDSPLSRKVVKICGRLPLALEIIGSFLNGKDKRIWETTLKKLKAIPNKEVKSKLNISFEALDYQEKEIFLDICCFFIGFDVRIVIHMWDSYNFFPEPSLEVLKQMSLIKITEGNRLWVHDQLRDLGRDIICQNGSLEPEKRSRVWDHEESIDLIGKKRAKNLKVLNLTECKNLRKTLDFSAHENLEQLILQGCKELVQVDKSIGKLKCLRFLNLKGCRNLWTLPDEMEELEALTELIVDSTSITKIPEWKGMKKLETLSAVGCISLRICNLGGCSTSLSILRLEYTQITEFPFENFGSLVELNISNSEIQELPNLIGKMKNLRVLRVSCTYVRKLPRALGKLEKLEEIYVDNREHVEGEIPIEIQRLSFMRILILRGMRISVVPKLPESLTNLSIKIVLVTRFPDLSNLFNLRDLSLGSWYEAPPHLDPSLEWISRLRKLESLSLSCRIATLPSDFNLLSKLKKLILNIDNLEHLPRLPENLSSISINGHSSMGKLIDLSYLEKLSKLEVYHCKQLIEIQGLECLKNLKELRLEDLPSLVKLPDLTNLTKLWTLCILYCPKLVEVRGQLESLDILCIRSCESLEKLPYRLGVDTEVCISNSQKLKEIPGLEDSKNLFYLYFMDLPLLEKLPDLTNLKKLLGLSLVCCPRLVEI